MTFWTREGKYGTVGRVETIIPSVVLVLAMLVAGAMTGCPKYNVWQQHMEGKAELAKAEYSRQVAVVEARAKQESAKALAQAEIERAKGVAQTNQIIGDSLKGNEDYLRYLWIAGIEKTTGQIIYVPTEANLPILEASRNKK